MDLPRPLRRSRGAAGAPGRRGARPAQHSPAPRIRRADGQPVASGDRQQATGGSASRVLSPVAYRRSTYGEAAMLKRRDAAKDVAAWHDDPWGREAQPRPGPHVRPGLRLPPMPASGRLASASVAAQVFAGNRLILVVESLLTGRLF